MINLLQLSKILLIAFFFTLISFNLAISEEADEAVDIWKSKKNNEQQKNQIEEDDSLIESPILSQDENILSASINELKLKQDDQKIVGLFDPEKNNFDLSMWSSSDGEDVKKVFGRINKLKLSRFSEDLLFNLLFTNSYPPKKNLNSSEFLKMKINWLIKNQRVEDLENLLSANPVVGKQTKAIRFLVDEYLSSANIKSACEKTNFINKDLKNDYLDKFKIYCLINNDRKEEAQLVFDLARERGLKDSFFEKKIYKILGISEDSKDEKILDNNLLNFYLSHITAESFNYVPNDKTDKYIWRYLSSANLIEIENFEDEEVILTYEQAAANDSFDKNEIFKIYLKLNFNFNQLKNVFDVYKNLNNYKARALIYQSILLSDNVERKIDLSFLLRDLFKKDKIYNVYKEELLDILRSIDTNEIPNNYTELVEKTLEQDFEDLKKIKFDNEIIHRSKVIKHFLDNNEKISKTEKDFKSVYKKVKRNKKYFISIKDIIVLESLAFDGVTLPKELDYSELSSQLTVPQNLQKLVSENQLGLVILKIIEIIGEDNIEDLDPETIYFLSKILNELNLKKIRNNILSEALPYKV